MGFFDFFKRSRARKVVAKLYGGDYRYMTWNYAQNLYTIPEVKIAINKIAEIFSTIKIWHERIDADGYITYKRDKLQDILTCSPNPIQNKSQFLQNCVSQLLYENNIFIEPIFDSNGELETLYPLPYKVFNINIDESANNGYIEFLDERDTVLKTQNLQDIIFISRFNTIKGGTKNNLGLYETVMRALEEYILQYTAPNKPRAILQSTSAGAGNLKQADKQGTRDELKESFSNTIRGVAYLDQQWQVTPINWNESELNKDIMAFIINVVYNYFGINQAIINNEASEYQMSSFIHTTIQPMAEQFEAEFTRKLFTARERAFGAKIEFDYTQLLFTTWQAEASAAQTFLRAGVLSIDEERERLGYAPLPNGLGNNYRASADTVNLKVIDKYELGKVGATVNSKKEEEQPNGDESKA